MTTIPDVADALHRVLNDVAEEEAYSTGFVRRSSKLSGPAFAQGLVFGWLGNAQASLSSLAKMTAAVGVKISNQGLDKRFTQRAAIFMREVLQAVVAEVIAADQVAIPLLQRFNGVVLQDSSTVVLPNALRDVWRGNGSRTGNGEAAVKMQVRLDLSNGKLQGPLLEDGRTQDKSSSIQTEPLPTGALRIADLGYFSLGVLQDLEAQKDYYLSRLQIQTVVFDEEGNRLDLLHLLRETGAVEVDIPVQLGVQYRLKARLLAVRVPQEVADARRRRMRRAARVRGQTVSKKAKALADWTILVTNAPKEKLTVDDALAIARARWQIELMFKLWKQHGKIDEWRSKNPWRILCEFYAKLVAVVIQHWLSVVGVWRFPDRSLVKAAQTVRDFAIMLASGIAGVIDLEVVISQIKICLEAGCRMNRRKKKPNTYQLMLDTAAAA